MQKRSALQLGGITYDQEMIVFNLLMRVYLIITLKLAVIPYLPNGLAAQVPPLCLSSRCGNYFLSHS